jgi:hypothetical protein
VSIPIFCTSASGGCFVGRYTKHLYAGAERAHIRQNLRCEVLHNKLCDVYVVVLKLGALAFMAWGFSIVGILNIGYCKYS